MKTISSILIFCITTISWGQSVQSADTRFLTYEQNENWLLTLKSFDKSEQWAAIKQRFFLKENQNISVDSIQYSPLIVINGIPLNIPSKLTDKDSGKILKLFNEDSIDGLTILDKLTDDWIFCKPFSGVIILTVDNRTGKKFSKFKLE
jgi:hypothetical protein